MLSGWAIYVLELQEMQQSMKITLLTDETYLIAQLLPPEHV